MGKEQRLQDRKPVRPREMRDTHQFCAERQSNLPGSEHRRDANAENKKAALLRLLLRGLSGREQLLHHTHHVHHLQLME